MKIILLIISSFLIIFFTQIYFNNISFLYLSDDLKFKNMNFQGIECINDNINIIEHSGDIFELIDNKLNFIASLLRKDAKTIKEKNSLVHSNSILLLNQNMLVSNALDKLSAKIAFIDYNKFLKTGYVSEDNYTNLNNNFDLKGTYLEMISFDESKLIFLITKNFDNNYSYQIYDSQFSDLICSVDMDESNIQNITWSNETNTLSVIKNPIKNRFGQINNYKMSKQDNCFKFNLDKKIIILNAMELQDYKKCDISNYFVFTKNKNSHIFRK